MLNHHLHVSCNLFFDCWIVWSNAIVSGCCQSILVSVYHLDVALSIGELVFKHWPNPIDLDGYLLVVWVGVVLLVLRSVLLGLVLVQLLLMRLEVSGLRGVALVPPIWSLSTTDLRWSF